MADKKISALTGAATPLAGTEVLPIVQSGSTVKVSVANLTAGRDISTTGMTVSSNTGNIELNWAAGSTHKVGSTFSTAYFTGMRVDADTRNTDIVSFDASGIGNVRIRTGVTETTKLNVDPTGNVTVNTGNLVIGTAGKGIDFSAATHAAGMTSELLNDYEEGTWTTTFPNQSNITGALTLSNGKYTRVGRLVMIEGKFSGNVTALLTLTFFQFTLPIARGATTDSGAGNVITANGLKLGGIENVNADTTTAYVILPSNSGQPTGVDTFLFTYTYSA